MSVWEGERSREPACVSVCLCVCVCVPLWSIYKEINAKAPRITSLFKKSTWTTRVDLFPNGARPSPVKTNLKDATDNHFDSLQRLFQHLFEHVPATCDLRYAVSSPTTSPSLSRSLFPSISLSIRVPTNSI